MMSFALVLLGFKLILHFVLEQEMASMLENFEFYVKILENNLLKVKSDQKAALKLIEEIVVIDFYDQWCVNRLWRLVRHYQEEERDLYMELY